MKRHPITIEGRHHRPLQVLAVLSIVGVSLILAGCPPAPATAPGAPTGVTVVTETTGDGVVSVSWSAVNGATSYNIYWGAATGLTVATGTKIADVTSPAMVNDVAQGTESGFIITAVNSAGESSPSTVATLTLPTTTSHVYASGEVGGYPVYWKDGVVHHLGTAQHYSGGPIAVSASGGVYVAVYDFTGATQAPAFWNNGTMQSLSLPNGTTLGWLQDIQVIGTDVYISGTVKDGSGTKFPVYWVNGTLYALSVGTDTTGYAGSIFPYQSNVYIAGTTSTPSTDGNVVDWQVSTSGPVGSVLVENQGPGNGWGWIDTEPGRGGVTSDSGTGYQFGTTYTSQGGEPVSWDSTGTPTVLTTTGTGVNYVAQDLVVSGGTTYFVGDSEQQSDETQGVPEYWLNGTMSALPLGGATVGAAFYVEVTGGHVYILGDETTRMHNSVDKAIPLYWVDGTLTTVTLPTGDPNGEIQGMGVSGSDVYFMATTGVYSGSQGNIDFNQTNHPAYWKNGNVNVLPLDGNTSGFVNGMLVSAY